MHLKTRQNKTNITLLCKHETLTPLNLSHMDVRGGPVVIRSSRTTYSNLTNSESPNEFSKAEILMKTIRRSNPKPSLVPPGVFPGQARVFPGQARTSFGLPESTLDSRMPSREQKWVLYREIHKHRHHAPDLETAQYVSYGCSRTPRCIQTKHHTHI